MTNKGFTKEAPREAEVRGKGGRASPETPLFPPLLEGFQKKYNSEEFIRAGLNFFANCNMAMMPDNYTIPNVTHYETMV